MMPEKLVQEKMNTIRKTWQDRYEKGLSKEDKSLIEANLKIIEILLTEFSHADGNQRVHLIGDPNTYLVPVEHIILYGLHGTDCQKFPIAKGE